MPLNPGDIAFVQYNADGTDDFAFVALTDIAAGETILFTDNGWFAAGGFRANEGVIEWTAPAGGLAAGTVVTIDTTPSATAGTATVADSGLNFSGSGDQVIAYQETGGTIAPIAALNNEGAGVFQSDATSSNTSALPAGLALGLSAVAIDEVDNVAYQGPTSGDRASLAAALFDAANWTGGDNSENRAFAGSFEIGGGSGGGEPPAVVLNELRISSPGGSDNAINYVELVAPAGTSLDGVTLVVLSGEFAPGQVDFAVDLDGASVDEDGFLLVRNAGLAGEIGQAVTQDTDVVADFDFFGSPSTFLLVEGFTGAGGDDLDADDDGVLDGPIGTVIDGVSLVDGDTTEDRSYAATVIGPAAGGFTPAGVARRPDGTGDFAQLVFDDLAEDTPGATNAQGDPGNGGGPRDVRIHEIQGNAATQLPNLASPPRGAHDDVSPLFGESVRVQGVVTAVHDGLRAFFVQEEDADADADPSTSEGILVFFGNDPSAVVSEGDLVTVTGAVDEFFGMTQIDNDNGDFSVTVDDAGGNLGLVTPAVIDLPATGDIDDFYEQYEGMLVEFADRLVVSEYFQLARFGQIVLTEGARPFQYTHLDATPTVEEFAAFEEDLARRTIILDDDDNIQNSPLPDGTIFHPQPGGFGIGTQGEDFFRGGDSVTGLTGVLHWSFAGFSGTDAWRIRPTEAAPVEFEVENPRPAAPEPVGGNVTVANFNVLNYFTTIDEGSNTVGPAGLDPRGASSLDELARQTEKLVAALAALDADLFGLVELENDADDATLAAITGALNAEVGAGTYDFVASGFAGTDAIKVGYIYKPAVLAPSSDLVIVDEAAFTDPNGSGQQRSRPALVQEWSVVDTQNADFGESFTTILNHYKSKGASGLDEDPSISPDDVDRGDGQGFWNDSRTDASIYLADVVVPQILAEGYDPDIMILGDLNAYKGETPITELTARGYTDLVEEFVGEDAYSFVFDGQIGYLDHALANESLAAQVTGVTEWHVNADEVNVFDYNNTVQDGNERDFEAKPTGNVLFEPNAFRISDHDPVLIGLDLQSATPVAYVIFEREVEGRSFTLGIGQDGAPVYLLDGAELEQQSPNAFLAEATLALGGEVVRDGAISEDALEHFGGRDNPFVRYLGVLDKVLIAGRGVKGQFRAEFESDAAGEAFEDFAQDLLGRDPRETEIFGFLGFTNGGANRIQILANDEVIALNPEIGGGFGTPDSFLFRWSGSDARGRQTETGLDAFIGQMGKLWGGTQLEDGVLTGFGTATGAALAGEDLDRVDFGSEGVEGREVWQFDDRRDAERFLDFFEDVQEAFRDYDAPMV